MKPKLLGLVLFDGFFTVALNFFIKACGAKSVAVKKQGCFRQLWPWKRSSLCQSISQERTFDFQDSPTQLLERILFSRVRRPRDKEKGGNRPGVLYELRRTVTIVPRKSVNSGQQTKKNDVCPIPFSISARSKPSPLVRNATKDSIKKV